MFRIKPFSEQAVWHPHLLNGPTARVLTLSDLPTHLNADDTDWFIRPVGDNKEIAGTVKTGTEILDLATKVMALAPDDIPQGSLRHDTRLMLCPPVNISQEWRLWAVDGKITAHSLYKEGPRVTYRCEIDDDALAFAQHMVDLHPTYARAYVLDICRTADGLHLLETNCLNAAGFYAADLTKLAHALNAMPQTP